jgi:2'-5' RNA ligase
MSSNWDSVNYSVCVIMPPRELWAPFISIKKNHMNPNIKRPPYPHITLCAPFVHPKFYKDAKNKLRDVLKNIEPFEICFANFDLFKNNYSTTLYLAPESEVEINLLYKELIATLPWNIAQKQNNFEPHIGVGFFKGKKNDAEFLQKKYQADWTPLKFTVQEIYFLRRRSQDSPWEIEEIVPLGEKVQQPVFKIGETTDSSI